MWLILLLKPILSLFTEKENRFEIDREPIFDGGGHTIWLVPDDLVAEYPTSIHHLNGEPFRDETEGFRENID